MDSLRRDDVEKARATPPAVKLQQALAAMDFGIDIERASLRSRHPGASEAELEALLLAWLARDH
jgi:hypothetical protein